jgi:hypothetical protein
MRRIVSWIAAIIAITAVFCTVYLVMQQSERQGANDAPERLASQVASRIDAGQSPDSLTGDDVALERSLAPFFVVYDSTDRPIAGTATLDARVPDVPAGVLAATRRAGSDRVTWQPRQGLRFASVELVSGNEVVMAGQSLAPTENRIDQIGLLVLAAWALTIAVVMAAYFVDGAVRSRFVAKRAGFRASSSANS